MNQKFISSLFFLTVLLWQTQQCFAQNQSSVEKRADQAFAKKAYGTALVDYRQLLAKDQQNPKFNYRYGVCIFETENHFAAAKYFDVVLGIQQVPDPLLYYYRGRIYQESYFFNAAIKAYEQYQALSVNQKDKIDLSKQISACQRAVNEVQGYVQLPLKSLLSTESTKFYAQYKFASDDYTFYQAPELHTKNNQKFGHIPVYAYKRGMKYRILASYGPKDTQLDLYLQRKDANNNWGEALRIEGGINTPFSQESFAFYDAEAQVIYFTSDHNSIGGYDLYKANYDLSSNMVSDIQRMAYPYSSPADDLFYVVDRNLNQAYFATTRQGQVGQYEIYTLDAEQAPKPTFVFAGNFFNELLPQSKSLSLQFTDLESGVVYGPFLSNEDGVYQVGIQQNGTYLLGVKVEGASQIYNTRFEVPNLKNQTTLQQQIRYFADEFGKEQWQVRNLLIEADPEQQMTQLSNMQFSAARGQLLQSGNQEIKPGAFTSTNIAKEWGMQTQDTAAFVAALTDSLFAAEVSLENQVRLMELLRRDFQQQLSERESILVELDQVLMSGTNKENIRALQNQLKSVEAALDLTQKWIAINQEANIPDLVLLEKLQEINERNQYFLLQNDTLGLVANWTAQKSQIKQYLQIAAFDGQSALQAAQSTLDLQLRQTIKEESAMQTQISQINQQIKQLQTDLPLQSKKEQAQTQVRIQQLQVQQQDLNRLSQQIADKRAEQVATLAIFNQPERIGQFIENADKQALPNASLQASYEDLVAEYAQQEVFAVQVKSKLNSNENPVSNENPNLNQNNVAQENPISNENPVSNENPNSNQNNVAQENPISNENPVSNENPNLNQNNVAQENPISNENPVSNENPNSNQNNVAQENPISNENPVSNENPNSNSNQNNVAQENPISNENPVSIENPNSNQNNVAQENPISNENPTSNANLQRIDEFLSAIETLSNIPTDEILALPQIERLSMSNQALLTLDKELELPADLEGASEMKQNILRNEQALSTYLAYVQQRAQLEETKLALQEKQVAIRKIELSFSAADKALLLGLLDEQEQLIKALQNQQQVLLSLPKQAQMEALLESAYLPGVRDLTASANTSQPQPSFVFAIQEPKPGQNSTLPVGLPCPEGLVFRVQVGAFRKPVPSDRFREFTPVDGQVLANGLTVYMAGYFQSSADALAQQKKIRALGYTDAFVVAYDGCQRLSLAQGRQREPKATLFADPGQGLYYSVQVGVYNKPLASADPIGLPELIEAKTQKGQYRYASGQFDNLNAAKARQQEAVAKGIKDAFIVAYYQGQRIDLATAKTLSNAGIAFTTTKEQRPTQPTGISIALQQQVKTAVLPQIQTVIPPDPVVRYERKCEDCIAELSKLNRVGIFIYDPEKEMIYSGIQKESEWTVVQQLYLKDLRKRNATLKGNTTSMRIEGQMIGDFADWLLRQQNPYAIKQTLQGLQIDYIQQRQ